MGAYRLISTSKYRSKRVPWSGLIILGLEHLKIVGSRCGDAHAEKPNQNYAEGLEESHLDRCLRVESSVWGGGVMAQPIRKLS